MEERHRPYRDIVSAEGSWGGVETQPREDSIIDLRKEQRSIVLVKTQKHSTRPQSEMTTIQVFIKIVVTHDFPMVWDLRMSNL